MIIVITVVMLLTLIPLAIFTQAVQQLPLARHDQDHEAALARGRSRRRRLPQPPRTRTATTGRTARRNRRPDGNPAFTSWVPVPGPSTNGETFRYTPDTTKTRDQRHRLPHVDGQVAQRDAHGEGRDPAPGLPRLPLLTDYEIIDPALSGERVDVHVPRVGVERRASATTGRTRRRAASSTGPTSRS